MKTLLIDRIKAFLAPPIFPDDEDKTHTAKALNSLLLTLMALLIFIVVVTIPFVYDRKLHNSVFAFMFLCVLVLAYRLIRKGHVKCASVMLVIVQWIFFTAFIPFAGGMESIAAIFYVSNTIITGLLLGTRIAILHAIACVIAGLGMVILDSIGYMPPRAFPLRPIAGWLDLVISLVLILAVSHIVLRSLKEALDLAQRQKATLQQATLALQESQERLDLALYGANEGIWDWQLDTNTVIFDTRYYTMAGYEPNEFPSTFAEWEKRVHPDDLELTNATITTYLAKESPPYDVEFRFRRKSGDYMWIRAKGRIVARDVAGKPTRFIGTHADITERKQAEIALIAERNRANSILEGTNAGTWDWNIQTDELIINNRWAEIIGYGLEELLPVTAETWTVSLHPEDLVFANAQLSLHFAGKLDYYDVVFRQKHKNGSWVWVNARGKVVKWTQDGHPLYMSGTHLDITEQKQIELALRNSEAHFRGLFENSMFGIVICRMLRDEAGQGIDFEHVQVNPATYKHTGMAIHHLTGKCASEIASPEEVAFVLPIYNQVVDTGQPAKYEQYFPVYDRTLEVSAFHNEGDYFALIFADITERKRTEQEIRKFKKALDAASDAIGMSTPDGQHYYQNAAFDALFGDIGNDPPASVYVDEAVGREAFKTAMAGGEWSGEVAMYGKGGTVLDIFLRAYAIKEKGHIINLVGIHTDITERKQAEIALREEKAFTDMALDSQMDTFFLFDPTTGQALRWNRMFRKITGYTDAEIAQLPAPVSYYSAADLERAAPFVEHVLQRGYGSIELDLICKDGQKIPTEYRVSTVNDANGQPKYLISVGRDITERKRAEAQLMQSNKNLQMALQSARMGTWNWDVIQDRVIWSDETHAIFGSTPETFGGTYVDYLGFALPSEREMVDQIVKTFFAQATDWSEIHYEHQILSGDGATKWIEVRGMLFRDDEGQLSQMIGVCVDITERKQIEQNLQDFSDGLREVVAAAHELLLCPDLDTLYRRAVELARERLGVVRGAVCVRDGDQMHGTYGTDLNGCTTDEHGADFKLSESTWCTFVMRQDEEQTWRQQDVELTYYQNGKTIYSGTYDWSIVTPIQGLNESLGVFFNDPGLTGSQPNAVLQEVLVVYCSLLGHTIERLYREQEVHQLRNYLVNIINSMPSTLIGVTPQGIVTQWNSYAERMTGIPVSQAVGQSLTQTFPRLASEMPHVYEAIETGKVQIVAKRTFQDAGATRYEDITIYPLIANGVEGAVIRVDDVTERVRLEEMMVQSEKMLSVGGLAAGMAHEINNPLAGMVQTANVMRNRLSSDLIPANICAAEAAGTSMTAIRAFMEARGIPRMLDAINESGQRMAEIVHNMLSFARRSESLVSSHNLTELLDKTVELAATDYDLKKQYDFKNITITRDYDPQLPLVLCERSKIQQVFLNILRNGAQAMLTGDTPNPTFVLRTYFDMERAMACVAIQDNGPGMDEATRKRVFEPFFTTKPVGEGTGLGLSVSYFIITENHSGEMDVVAELGKGATFIIRLPVKRDA